MDSLNLKFYKVIKVLGKGGMATVYLAKHRLLQNEVAIKVLNKEFLYNSNIKNRFISEARKLAQLEHPNIVRVIDLLEEENQIAIVMEYLEGESLKDTLVRKKLNDDEIKSILKQMVTALEYIHEIKFIHRDIKPSNFIFDKIGNLKLTDFGISKDTSALNSEYTQTATSVNMGTPMYMSPEQIRSLKEVTKLSDIYSLGVVLWEMVSGKKPYNTQTLSSFELQTKIVNEKLPLTHTKWDAIIQKATVKNENYRLNKVGGFLNQDTFQDTSKNLDFDKTIISEAARKTKETIEHSKISNSSNKKRVGLFIVGIALIILIAFAQRISFHFNTKKYDWVDSLKDNLAKVRLNDKYGFVDKSGREIIPFKYDSAKDFNEGLAKVELNEKWGFIDKTGKEVIQLKYDEAKEFNNGITKVMQYDRWISIDRNGECIENCLSEKEEELILREKYFKNYDFIDLFIDGLAKVELKRKWGFIDKSGKEVIPLKYDYARNFSEGLAAVKLNGKWGFIDTSGREVIPFKYKVAGSFHDNLAYVYLNDKWGAIDKVNQVVIPFKYYSISRFNEGLAQISMIKEMKIGFINKYGVEVIPLKYQFHSDSNYFKDGLARVKLNWKWGFIDTFGHEVIPFKYDWAGIFHDGLARVKLNGKWGFIDTSGREVIPFKYDNAWGFSEGLARVKLNGKWGFVDKSGKEVIPFKYDNAWDFSEDLVDVKLNGKWGFVDKSGKEVIPFKYDDTWNFSEDLAGVKLNGKWGFVDKSGKEVIPFKYEIIEGSYEEMFFKDGLVRVKLNGKSVYINKKGECVRRGCP